MYPARPLGSLREYQPSIPDGHESVGTLFWKLIFVRLFHWLCKLIRKAPSDINIPLLPKMMIKRNWKKMMDEIIKMGITSITEAGIRTWKELDILKELKENGELKVRCNILLASRIMDEAIDRGIKTGDGDEWIRITGVKLYADGWMTPRTAAMIEPYDDYIGKGVLFYEPEKAEELIQKLDEAGLRIATHAIGDRGIKTMIDAYDKFPSKNKDHRCTIEHATVMRIDSDEKYNLISRMQSSNIIASYQLGFAAIDNKMSEKALGEKRYQYCYPWRSLLDNNVKLIGGSDWPIDTVSPFWGIEQAVTRKKIGQENTEVCNPKQKITIEEALHSLTSDAAFHSYDEENKGTIQVGKLADLVVLSEDILKFTSEEKDNPFYVGNIHHIEVAMTIIDGKTVYNIIEN
jgi:predicted amidohydrolase YtcJ